VETEAMQKNTFELTGGRIS